MLHNKRKFRKRNKRIKRVGLFLLYFFIVIAISGGGYYVYLTHSQKNSPSPTLHLATRPHTKKDPNLNMLERLLREKQISFSSVTPTNSDYIVHLENKSDIIISSQKNIHSQISSLQFILPRLTMEGKPFSRLDLRFDKPILTE